MSVERPLGVTVIAVVFLLVGIIGILVGVVIAASASSSQSVSISIAVSEYYYILNNISMFPPQYASLLLNFAYWILISSIMGAIFC